MCLIAHIRVLITTLVLASFSPFGLDVGHPGHLAISLFIGRRTRVAASQQFDVAGREPVQSPALPISCTSSEVAASGLKHANGSQQQANRPKQADYCRGRLACLIDLSVVPWPNKELDHRGDQ